MPNQGFERAVIRTLKRLQGSFAEDVVRLRIDAGLSRRQLAAAAGVNDSYLAKIEGGMARPSTETCVRIGLVLGADLGHRLYPTTGSTVRDRHQLPITEALLRTTNRRWARFLEINVRSPSRGWIDAGFHDPTGSVFVATEIESQFRRAEQLLRWAAAKAAALPSWDGFARLGAPPAISQLLVVRETRVNRFIAADYRRALRSAYPADPEEALESLTGTASWPGAAILWAVADKAGAAGYRIVARL